MASNPQLCDVRRATSGRRFDTFLTAALIGMPNWPVQVAARLLLRRALSAAVKLIIIGAVGFVLLSGGQRRDARAAIIITQRAAGFTLQAFAVSGAQIDNRPFDHQAPPGFTSFSTGSSVNASASSAGGTDTGRAQGSTATTISLAGDELRLDSMASFDTGGTSTTVFGSAGGSGQGTFALRLAISVTERPVDYSFSGLADHNLSGNATSLTNYKIRRDFSFEPILDFADTHRNGSGSVPISGSGELPVGTYTVSLDHRIFAGAGMVSGTPGPPADGKGSFRFNLTLESLNHWLDPADGVFQTGGNWSNGAPPSGADNAVIDVPGSYTITLQGNAAHNRLRANGAGVNVTIDANDFDYVLDEISVGGRDGDDVSITFDDSSGVVVSAASAAAGDDLAQAAASASAADEPEPSFFAQSVRFGHNGRGFVKAPTRFSNLVLDEGTTSLSILGAKGFLVIDQSLTVGRDGQATVIVSAGGTLIAANEAQSDQAVLGQNFGSSGKVTVTGNDSNWNFASTVVGRLGIGELNIRAGGDVGHGQTSQTVTVADDITATGTVTVEGVGSLLSIRSLNFGRGGGILDVKAGGEVKLNELVIKGVHDPNDQTDGVTVSDFGEIRVVNQLTVGLGGRMTVADSGFVVNESVAPGSSAGTVVATTGKLIVNSGGRFHEHHSLEVNGEVRLNGSGTALVGMTVPLANRSVTVGPGGNLSGTGHIFGFVALAGGTSTFPPGNIHPRPARSRLTAILSRTAGCWGSRSPAPRQDSSMCWP